MRAAAVVLGAAALLGCAPGQSEPIFFAGTLEDELGMPVPGATVVLEAYEQVDVPAGQAPPVAFRVETTSGPDGRFEFRFSPNEQLRQLRIRNRGPIGFTAWARVPERNLAWSLPFVRDFDRDGWIDVSTRVRWRPAS
jgi:hypothetical protein